MNCDRATPPETEAMIHANAIEHPAWSIRRVHRALFEAGIRISYPTVYKLLTRNRVDILKRLPLQRIELSWQFRLMTLYYYYITHIHMSNIRDVLYLIHLVELTMETHSRKFKVNEASTPAV